MAKFIKTLSVLFLVLFPFTIYAQSTLPLQEKCSEGARKFVESIAAPTSYNCHYNKILDRCFLRVGYYLGQIQEDLKLGNGITKTIKHPQWMVVLYDAFDGKKIAVCAYTGSKKEECWVGNTKCKSEEEFENLIRPYMEE